MAHRSRVLTSMAQVKQMTTLMNPMVSCTSLFLDVTQDFMAIAERHRLAVVHMNQVGPLGWLAASSPLTSHKQASTQVTTKIQEGQESKLTPALGDSWGHAASTRVILYWDSDQRYAHVFKSPSQPTHTVPFFIVQDGVRGLRPGAAEKRPRE